MMAGFSMGGADTVRAELQLLPEFQGQANGPLWEHLATLAEQINGMPRHVSQHVGGMIISSRPLIELVPVQPAAWPGRFICQWDKDSCDDARFIKIDFLALGMLSQKSIVALDEERKASMVSNLLVVLCGDRNTQPVINAGTIYQ